LWISIKQALQAFTVAMATCLVLVMEIASKYFRAGGQKIADVLIMC